MQTLNSKPFIIFLHIQKTGGITLQRLLRRKLGLSLQTRAIRLFTERHSAVTVEQQLQRKKLQDRYVVGHFCYGIHQYLPQPFTYMTFLREPVARIISLYDYSRTNPTAYYHQHALNKSLEEFALQTQLMELDNGQMRFLAGSSNDYFINRTPIGQCDSTLLATAKRNIETHFSFIGITEYFDQSILLLQQIMDWNSCLYLRRNSSQIKDKAIISDQLKHQIAERNWLDIQLYEYAKNLLWQKLESSHLDDLATLENFKQANAKFNARLGAGYSIYSQAKALIRGQIGRPS